MKIHRRFLARSIGLLLTFGALFALSWYFFGREQPQQGAVAATEPKTTQDLLIGKWRIVEMNNNPVPDDWEMTMEFTRDGKHIDRLNFPHLAHTRPKEAHRELIGTYTLEGMTIHCVRAATKDEPGVGWSIEIQSISDGELIIRSGPIESRQTDRLYKQR